jgi:hypothetical protein
MKMGLDPLARRRRTRIVVPLADALLACAGFAAGAGARTYTVAAGLRERRSTSSRDEWEHFGCE